MAKESIPKMFLERAAKYGRDTALRYKYRGEYTDVSWEEFEDTVERAAFGLMASGVQKGDRVALLSENRIEWLYADMAILSCGAINVPVYATDTPKEIEYILSDSGSRIIFVSSALQLEKVLLIKKNLPELSKIVIFDKAPSKNHAIIEFPDLLSSGEEFKKKSPGLFAERVNAVEESDLASIIYTSGTTGPPKGVMLTHYNFLSNCRSCSQAVKIDHTDAYLSFLPLSHVFERTVGYYLTLYCGATIAYAENLDTVARNIREISPTMACGVPRFYEKVYARILDEAIRANFLKKNLFFWAVKTGRRYGQRKLRREPIGLPLMLSRAIAKLLVFNKLRKALGGRLRFFISGGAPLSKEIAEFFYAADILILEGYGLTETSPVISVNRPENFKFGTVGQPLPGVEVKIADDGEILTRGASVMKGYYKNEGETRDAIRGGWLYTGDIGCLDKDNFLAITDRKKEIIVTAGGKNVAPQNIENLLKTDRYISEIMVYGDRRKYLVALVIPNFDDLKKYAEYKKIPYEDAAALVKEPRINDFIGRRISKKMADMASYQQIKKFTLLDKPFTQEAGELTPTLKIKRKVISEKYKNLLEAMYESR